MNSTKIKLPSNWKILVISLLFVVLGFSVYYNVLTGGFIWDDEVLVQNNRAIRDLSGIPNLFTKDIGGNYKFYRPMFMVVYAIEYAFFGLNVQVYHFVNILIHIITALSVYYLVYLFFGNQTAALFCGLLFLIHPVQTEAVAYISGLADPLGALFIIWSFIFYIKYFESGKKLFYWLILISYTLALLSKENSLILPVVLLLYHYVSKVKFKIKQFFPILCLVFLYLFLRLIFFKPALLMQWGFLLKRLPGFFAAIANYIKILFLPLDLHMEYGNKIFHFYDPRVIIGAVLTVAILIYAFLKRNKNTLFFFSVAWFFITLLPYSNIYPLNAFMAEHWLYLPSIGFFIIISKWLADLYACKKLRILSIILMLVLSVAYFYLTTKQNNYWRNPIAFYNRTLEYAPGSGRIYYNLGNVYYNSGNYKQAIEMYKKAIEIKSDYGDAYFNLTQAYLKTRQYQQAIESCDKAFKLNVEDAQRLIDLLKPYRDKNSLENSL
jgi:protein O-mannosyl-transferase